MDGNEYRGMHPKDKEGPVELEGLVYQITGNTVMTHAMRKWKTVQVKTGSILHRGDTKSPIHDV